MRTLARNLAYGKLSKKIRTLNGCEKTASRRGFCESHAHRFYRYGDPLGGSTFHGQPRVSPWYRVVRVRRPAMWTVGPNHRGNLPHTAKWPWESGRVPRASINREPYLIFQ
jgi:hypothetical protein